MILPPRISVASRRVHNYRTSNGEIPPPLSLFLSLSCPALPRHTLAHNASLLPSPLDEMVLGFVLGFGVFLNEILDFHTVAAHWKRRHMSSFTGLASHLLADFFTLAIVFFLRVFTILGREGWGIRA